MPGDKEFKNVYDQIRLLKSRGLNFTSLPKAKDQLLSKGYFDLINGFETLLLEDPKNPPKKYNDINFDDFTSLYEFDKHLSKLIFFKIAEFETKLKTSIAYHFTKNHCSTILNNSNYIDISYYRIPLRTDGPPEYVSYFKKHKLFKKNYYYQGAFRGTFSGIVTYRTNGETALSGDFTGRFGSTSIREVKRGNLTLKNNKSSSRGILSNLHSLTTISGTSVSLSLSISNVRIYGISFIDDCKTKYEYINEYNNPPFWVTIKSLMLNDILVLMYGLDKRTFDSILKNFGLKPKDKDLFLNCVAIIKDLRNHCAHFELVNRFRTSKKIAINTHLVSQLNLNPARSRYVIRLFDTLKVLQLYTDIDEIKEYMQNYHSLLLSNGKVDLASALCERIGVSDIKKWI